MSSRVLALLCMVIAAATAPLRAFDSQSDGSDGPLDLSGAEAGQVVFDPRSFEPPLDPDGDNVFHFTTITIPVGVELVFEARKLHYSPVYWLASGAVRIDGVLNLQGAPGHAVDDRRYAEPGPGGFHGGLGGRSNAAGTNGLGPGGGAGNVNPRAGSHATRGIGNGSGQIYGNRFLLPLVGGSGGGGFVVNRDGTPARGGGAGGGAILIASSESVTVSGTINAAGGSGATGGSGGAVRILSPVFSGAGTITASGGPGFNPFRGGSGWIRIEATERTFSGSLSGVANVVTLPPQPVFVPRPGPRVRITRIAGIAVTPSPTGSFAVPDLAINSSAAVTVEIEAAQIPPDTVVNLLILTEDSADGTVATTPLVGSLASSTASAEVIFSAGFSRVFIRATW